MGKMKYKARSRNHSKEDEKRLIENQITWQEHQENKYFEDELGFLGNEQKRIRTNEYLG